MSAGTDLLAGFDWAARGAEESEIAAAQSGLGVVLPPDYLVELRVHNGGEGWVGGQSYLRLWPVSQLVERNEALNTSIFVPGIILIGSDGADERYGIHIDPDAVSYLAVPAVGMSAGLTRLLGGSWDDFLKALAKTG
jgi:SMI1 / KNR4 family (SUKH-1)